MRAKALKHESIIRYWDAIVKKTLEMKKSSRHTKIFGDFAENLICHWLSRSGFEASIVDHTGIDIVAYNPETKERLGITVKSSCATKGKERESVNLHRFKGWQKVLDACSYFGCIPWIAVYVETTNYANIFLTSLENYNYKYRRERKMDDWQIGPKHIKNYESDKNVMYVHFKFEGKNWF